MAIPCSKVNPKFLNSNSTSHVWIFSAIAELIDNAYDPDVNAKSLIIDKEEIGEETCLVFQDNGAGMDNDHLHKMLSFGYCEKDELTKKSHLPVGHYGNGFKSGSMRLGKDAMIFTKHTRTASFGFLSQTYLTKTGADSVVVPLLEYSLPDMKRTDNYQSRSSLKDILNHSIFTEEKELIRQFERIKDKTGTRIIIYNLCKLSDGNPELDFDGDPKDILCRKVHMDDLTFTETMHTNKKLKYRQSLREYCKILYFWPKMKIILRGSTVRTKMIAKSLSQTEVDVYRPMWLQNESLKKKRTVQITIGFRCEDHDSEDYGMMMYHNNRLIKAYEKVGYQKQANEKGFGVIGVAQVDFLQPIHNKQDFLVDEKYNTVMKAFGEKLNDYWNEKDQFIQENIQSIQPDSLWANCDSCGKWRRLPKGTDKSSLPDEWFCSMNRDKKHSHCTDPEEKEKDDEYVRPTYQKNVKRKIKEQKSLEKQSRQSTQRTVSQEQEERSQLIRQSLTQSPGTSYSDSPSKNPVSRKRLANSSDQEENGSPRRPSPSKRIKRLSLQASDLGLKPLEFFFKKKEDCAKKIMQADSTFDCDEIDAAGNQMLEASTSSSKSDSMLHVTIKGNKDSSSGLTMKANHLGNRDHQGITLLPIVNHSLTETVSSYTHEKMDSEKNQTLSTSESLAGESDLNQKKNNSLVIINQTFSTSSAYSISSASALDLSQKKKDNFPVINQTLSMASYSPISPASASDLSQNSDNSPVIINQTLSTASYSPISPASASYLSQKKKDNSASYSPISPASTSDLLQNDNSHVVINQILSTSSDSPISPASASYLSQKKKDNSASYSPISPASTSDLLQNGNSHVVINQILSTSSDSPISPASDSDLSQKNNSHAIIDVETLPECSVAQIIDSKKPEDPTEILQEYQRKLKSLENHIMPPLVVARNVHKGTKFQQNVHYLLKLLVPKLVTGDVSSTEQLVEDLIGLIEATDLDF